MKHLFTGLLVACAIHVCAQGTLSNSLSACYAFSGNANDAINSLNGNAFGATLAPDRLGTPNSAYSMAFGSYIALPDDPLLKPSNEVSFSAWVYFQPITSSTATADNYIVFTENATGNVLPDAYSLCTTTFTNGARRFRVKKSNGSQDYVDGTTYVNPNTWYHVAYTIDNVSLKIYVNGALEFTGATTAGFSYQPGKQVYLGKPNTGSLQGMSGYLDNVRFYNRALSGTEIHELYANDPTCNSSGPPPVASFSVFQTSACDSGKVVLTDLSTNNPTAWNWQITGGTPSVSTLQNPTITLTSVTGYPILLTVANANGATTSTLQWVYVYQGAFVTALSTSSLVCESQTVALTAAGASTYTWSGGQVTPSIVVSQLTVGYYTYTVTGTDTNGCSNSATVSVQVADCSDPFPIGIKKINPDDNSITVYPNPGSGIFTINGSVDITGLTVRNVLGQVIYTQQEAAGKTVAINISNQPKGVYLVKINSQSGSKNCKIVKE